ncbi:MAG: response regulator, partial [Alphaproteobacteria bacterium]
MEMQGARALVVEDQAIVALSIVDALLEWGVDV